MACHRTIPVAVTSMQSCLASGSRPIIRATGSTRCRRGRVPTTEAGGFAAGALTCISKTGTPSRIIAIWTPTTAGLGGGLRGITISAAIATTVWIISSVLRNRVGFDSCGPRAIALKRLPGVPWHCRFDSNPKWNHLVFPIVKLVIIGRRKRPRRDWVTSLAVGRSP